MASEALRAHQRKVFTGVVLGLALQLTLITSVYYLFPSVSGGVAPLGPLFFTLKCNALAALALVAGVASVGNSRFLTEAIDPLAGKDQGRIIIYGRYLQNTLEQLTLFTAATFGLTATLGAGSERLVLALTVNFLCARALFFAGYLRGPLWRAPGFFMTMFPSFATLVYVALRFLSTLRG